MRQRGALGRALSRAAASRHALPASRLRLRTHRWWSVLEGGVPLHYLQAPRAPAAARIDGRLTVRVLLAEARAARAASIHAWLVCMTAAREFVNRMGRVAERGVAARGMQGLRWPVAGMAAQAMLLRGERGESGVDGHMAQAALRSLNRDTPGRVLLRLLRSPDRAAPRASTRWLRDVQRFQATRVLRTLASSRVLAGTRTFFRELMSRYLPSVGASRDMAISPGEPASRAAPAAKMVVMPAGMRTVFEPLRLAYLRMVEAAREPFASMAAAPRGESQRSHEAPWRHRLYPLAMRGHQRMRGAAPRIRPASRASIGISVQASSTEQAFAPIVQAINHLSVHHHSSTLTASAMAAAIMRLRTPSQAAVASTPTPVPRSYAAPAAALALRRTPRAAPAEHKRDVRQLQQQVARQVTQELAQNAPWRGQLEQAVLAPRVLRELAERVAGAIAGRQGLERYRRGL